MRLLVGCAVVVCTLVASVAAADTVVDIEVDGNSKTTDETVILIARLDPGDEWNPDVADRVRTELVSSGLFKQVEVWWDPVPGGVRVHITAKDKHSWVIAPTFYNQPTNKGGGIGFGENNLFGENEKLLLYAQVATGDSFFVAAYVDPSIAGTRLRWQYDAFLKTGRVIEYASPAAYLDDPRPLRVSRLNYLNQGLRLGLSLWKGLSLDGRLRGAWVSYSRVELAEGATLADVTGDPMATELPAPGKEGWDVSTEVLLGLDTRANWYGLSSGDRIQVSYERALPGLGSDFDYSHLEVRLEHASRYLLRHNLVVKAAFGLGHHLPFQQEFLVGGTAMRGWKNAQFHGDLRATFNAEYSIPLFTISGLAFRALTFWDSAYTTFVDRADPSVRNYLPDPDVRGTAPFKNSVGVGTRLFMRQIVLPLLGLDFGYGLERRDFEVYLAIGLTD